MNALQAVPRRLQHWWVPTFAALFLAAIFGLLDVSPTKAADQSDTWPVVVSKSFTATVPLDGKVAVSYTVTNKGGADTYFSSRLAQGKPWCWSGLQVPTTLLKPGESKIISGVVAGRCLVYPGSYNYTLMVMEEFPGQSNPGPSDVRFIQMNVFVPLSEIKIGLEGRFELVPSLVAPGDSLKLLTRVRNTSEVAQNFWVTETISLAGVAGSFTEISQDSSGEVDTFSTKEEVGYHWNGIIQPGSVVTLTLLGNASHFPGYYPGDMIAAFSNGDIRAQSILIALPAPKITSIEPANAPPGSLITIHGLRFLQGVAPGTPAHNLEVFFLDPQTSGSNSVNGDQVISWTDTDIQLLLPTNLKQDYTYNVMVYRQSVNPSSPLFQYSTGHKMQPQPAFTYYAQLLPTKVESEGGVTVTQTITNAGNLTGTTTTTVTIQEGIEEVVSMDGATALGNGQYRWETILAPGEVKKIHLVAKAVEVTSETVFPSAVEFTSAKGQKLLGMIVMPSDSQGAPINQLYLPLISR